MSEKVISFLLTSKDATASAFNRAKSGVKDLATDSQQAMSGIKAATNAVSQAMSGDLVGAAKSASMAFSQLWKVISKHPYMALAGAIGAVILAVPKLISYQKDAADAARDHESSIVGLKKRLDELNGTDLLSTVKGNIQSKIEALDFAGIAEDAALAKSAYNDLEKAANGYVDALERLKVGGLGKSQEEKEQKRLNAALDDTLSKMGDLKKAEDLYEKAIEARKKEMASASVAEKAASDLAIANAAAKIQAEIDYKIAILETFAEYERQYDAQNKNVENSVAGIQKQTARTIELMNATDSVAKAEIQRKHIQEDIAEMMDSGVADTVELETLQGSLLVKEEEIKLLKEDAALAAAKEAADRLKGAKDVLDVEEKIAKAKAPDLWDERGWRAKDPRKGTIDPWDALKNQKPEFPPPAPPLPANPNAPGQPAAGPQADPWSPKLDAIKSAVDALRGDLTGGAE